MNEGPASVPLRRQSGAVGEAVRELRPEDVPAVARVLHAAFAGPESISTSAGDNPAPITDELVARWSNAASGAWVADAPGFGPIGAVFAVIEPDVGWIGGLGVHPAFRHAGVGGALADAAIRHLNRCRAPLVGLEVAPAAADALALYARRGLVPVDVTIRLRSRVSDPGGGARFGRLALGELTAGRAAPLAAARIAATPLTGEAFALVGSGEHADALLVCEPRPTAEPIGGALEVRLAWFDRNDARPSLAAGAHAAVAAGKRFLDIDVPVAAGRTLGTLRRAGFESVAVMIRMVDRPARYVAGAGERPLAGRWSL